MGENLASFAKERRSNFTAAVKDGDFASQLSDKFLRSTCLLRAPSSNEGEGMTE